MNVKSNDNLMFFIPSLYLYYDGNLCYSVSNIFAWCLGWFEQAIILHSDTKGIAFAILMIFTVSTVCLMFPSGMCSAGDSFHSIPVLPSLMCF